MLPWAHCQKWSLGCWTYLSMMVFDIVIMQKSLEMRVWGSRDFQAALCVLQDSLVVPKVCDCSSGCSSGLMGWCAVLPEGFNCPGLLRWWDQSRLMPFLKKRVYLSYQKQISMYVSVTYSLQNCRNQTASCLFQSEFKRPSKQCETEEVSLNMTVTHQPQRLCFRFCVTACDCSSI